MEQQKLGACDGQGNHSRGVERDTTNLCATEIWDKYPLLWATLLQDSNLINVRNSIRIQAPNLKIKFS